MRILHTSDWHLGAQLHEQSRILEQAAFLEWLKALMRDEKPDALIIAGDIFDSCAPSNTAQLLYYEFLSATFKQSLCRSVVVIGGNHDSPSLLDAPGNVLTHLQTRVVGSVAYAGNDRDRPDLARETVVVPDAAGAPGLVIGAVPYLRDADLRTSGELESDADRSAKLKSGFKQHYAGVANLARAQRAPDGHPLPLVLTGHLFLSGSALSLEPSERDIHVGNLGAVDLSLLPAADYYALGHLHTQQAAGGSEACRYSGAPIPMSFGEAAQAKYVVRVDFSDRAGPEIELKKVPQTQHLAQLNGTPENIKVQLQQQMDRKESVWVDIQVTEGDGDLTPWWGQYTAMVEESRVRILRRQNARPDKGGGARAAVLNEASLENLKPADLFQMMLGREDLTPDQRREFSTLFAEVANAAVEADANKG